MKRPPHRTCLFAILVCLITLFFTVFAGYVGASLDPGTLAILLSEEPQLISIQIDGVTEVFGDSRAQYKCTAVYDDGNTTDVTAFTSWSENSDFVVFDTGGHLTASEVTSDQSCTLTALFDGKNATKTITIKKVVLDSIKILGLLEVEENAEAQFYCMAFFNNGKIANISKNAIWNVDQTYATISGLGLLFTKEVIDDQVCDISASFAGKTSHFHLVITESTLPDIQEVSLVGPDKVNESSGGQYMLAVKYIDGRLKRLFTGPNWDAKCLQSSVNSSGYLSTAAIAADQSCTISAKFGNKSASKTITIKDVNSEVRSLVISGPLVVNESSGAQYSCRANYEDGSSADVTSRVAWSDDAAESSLSSTGYLVANSVVADKNCRITAVFGGKSSSYDISIKNSADTAYLRIINNSPYDIVELRFNDTPQIFYPDSIPAHSQRDYSFATSGTIQVYLEVGRYGATGNKESIFFFSNLETVFANQTAAVVLNLNLADILTQWQQNHRWWADFYTAGVVGGQVQMIYHMAYFDFQADGSWKFYFTDDNGIEKQNGTGTVSLATWSDHATQITFGVIPNVNDAIMPFPFNYFSINNGPQNQQGQNTTLTYRPQ